MSGCKLAITVSRIIILFGLVIFLGLGFLIEKPIVLHFTLSKELNFSSSVKCLQYDCYTSTMQCWECKSPSTDKITVYSYNGKDDNGANLFMSFQDFQTFNYETYDFYARTYNVHVYSYRNLLEERKIVSAWPTDKTDNICWLNIIFESNQNINFLVLIPIGFITMSFLWELIVQMRKREPRQTSIFD